MPDVTPLLGEGNQRLEPLSQRGPIGHPTAGSCHQRGPTRTWSLHDHRLLSSRSATTSSLLVGLASPNLPNDVLWDKPIENDGWTFDSRPDQFRMDSSFLSVTPALSHNQDVSNIKRKRLLALAKSHSFNALDCEWSQMRNEGFSGWTWWRGETRRIGPTRFRAKH